jgi:hypothetical protein
LFVLDVVEFLLLDIAVGFDFRGLEMVEESEIVFFRETPGHDRAVDEEEDVSLFAGGEGRVCDVAGDVDAVFREGGEGVVPVVAEDGAEFGETEGFGDAVCSNRFGFGLCVLIRRVVCGRPVGLCLPGLRGGDLRQILRAGDSSGLDSFVDGNCPT